jgi:hypothetical protein
MANIVKVKRSATPAKVPTTSDLQLGEIAVNTYDGKMYIKKDDGTASIVQIGGAAGSGDVVGPSSATDNAIARFDTTTGKLIQNSVVIIGDTGSITGVNALTAESLVINNNATLGSSNTDTLDVNARITTDLDPNVNNAKDIGTSGRNWRDGFFGRTLSTVNIEVTGTAAFDGAQGTAGQVLTSAGTGNTPTWTTPTTGTVTSVTGTAPVVSSGGNTPAISMPAATTSVNGYLTSTDWNTFNNKTSNTGTVTSVAATAGTGISITGSPITTSGTLTITNTAPDQVVSLTGAGATSISGTYPNFTITSTNTTYALATSTTLGLIELGSDTAQTVAANAVTATASRTYALQVNAAGQGVINVPWTDTNSGGTVTSVGGTGTVSGLSLSGTVTTTGNLTLGGTLAVLPSNFASQTANTVLAAPNGTAGTPTFRALVAADIPTLNQNTTGTASNVTGTVAIANGGTGQTTKATAYNALSPITTTGDLIIGNGSNSATRLAIGTNGQVLTSNGTTATWSTAGGGTTIPAGTVMIFGQTTAPTGFTKLTDQDNAGLRVVSGTASTGGTVNFTTAFASQTPTGSVSISAVSGSAGATTLSTPQIPSHTHNTQFGAPGGGAHPYGAYGRVAQFNVATGGAGGGGSHTHPFSFSSGTASFSGNAINLAVKYVDVIRASKN